MRTTLTLLAVVLWGCGLQSIPGPTGGGGATAGGTDGTGGGMGTGGGSGTGGMGTYVQSVPTIDDPVDAGKVLGISGPSGNLFAVARYGRLFHSSDGNQFNRVFSSSRGFVGIYVSPEGWVFIAADTELGLCNTPPCTDIAVYSWSRPATAAPGTEYSALCGSSNLNVYAVGANAAGDAIITHWNGSAWGAEKDLGVGSSFSFSCSLESPMVVWVPGVKDVVRWDANSSFGAPQSADLTALGVSKDVQPWNGLLSIGGDVHVVGYNGAIMSRLSGTWSLTHNDSAQTLPLLFQSVDGLRANEVFAAGRPPTATGNELWRWNGSTWTKQPSFPLFDDPWSVHAVAPDSLYFGGRVPVSDTAKIVRLTRQ